MPRSSCQLALAETTGDPPVPVVRVFPGIELESSADDHVGSAKLATRIAAGNSGQHVPPRGHRRAREVVLVTQPVAGQGVGAGDRFARGFGRTPSGYGWLCVLGR
jgi:hypothetical protein